MTFFIEVGLPPKLLGAVLLLGCLLSPPSAFSQSRSITDTPSKPEGIDVYAAPDDAAPPIAFLSAGETTTPVAESQGSGGVKWYLIKTKSGVVGWIKQSDHEQAKKLDSFFKSLPAEPSASAQIPMTSSTSAPRGAIIVPVSLAGRSAIVAVTLNQAVRGNLMLDTGATVTVISHRLAGLLSLRPTGRGAAQTVGGVIAVATARLRSLKVAEAEVTDLPVIVHDFTLDPRFDGLLGMDFLGRYHVGLDAQKQVLVLTPR